MMTQARKDMGYSAVGLAQQVANQTERRLREWEGNASTLLQDTIALGHPLLVAEVLSARLMAAKPTLDR